MARQWPDNDHTIAKKITRQWPYNDHTMAKKMFDNGQTMARQ